MKISKHKGIVYLLSVIIPTLFITFTFYTNNKQYLQMEKESEAKQILSMYEQNLDKFINNTTTTLEMLSLTISTMNSTDEQIKKLLATLPNGDGTDFSAYYYARPEGVIYIGSGELENEVPMSDRHYYKELMEEKKTVFSTFVNDRVLGKPAIIVATPVEGDNEDLQGILIAILDLKNMETTINSIIDYPYYTVQEASNQQIIARAPPGGDTYYTHTEEIDAIPWSVTVYADKVTVDDIIERCIPAILFVLILTHIVYLLILYYTLKKEAALEKKQSEMQKIELIGSLAASTAHEIRNPLTGIKGFVTLLSQKYDNPQDNLYFSIIQNEITRINEIVSDFLVLGKPVEFDKEQHDLTEIINEVLPIIKVEAKMNGIQVNHPFVLKPTPIYCSKNHIKQILLNLSKNALQAMEENDTLTIKVRVKQNYAQLIVKDTGEGIPEERMKQIFQPFYTSKDTGTGLGLVICERIVETYGGKIIINSTQGKGTVVQVFFPLCTK